MPDFGNSNEPLTNAPTSEQVKLENNKQESVSIGRESRVKPAVVTPPPAAPPPKRAKRGFRPILILLLSLLSLVAVSLLYVRTLLSPVALANTQVTEFEVLPGWGANSVALALEDAGLVRNARAFSLYLRYQDLDRDVGEGLYSLSPSMAAKDLAATLVAGGRARTTTVLIPEGFRAVDIADTLSSASFGNPEVFQDLLGPSSFLKPEFVPAEASLEGYLFPAGYAIPVGSSPELAVTLMLERFERELTPELQSQLDTLGWSVHDLVTFASMVQSEAANAAEMPIIAGVFLNRLDEGMLLQSDPTVAYGLGKALPELDAVAGDMRADHPWNTYLYPGLPPGPISNPGRAALLSPFDPVRQTEAGEPYLYFLHGFDNGEKVFRPNTTLEAHNADVDTYLR